MSSRGQGRLGGTGPGDGKGSSGCARRGCGEAPFVVFSSGSLKEANCVALPSGVRKECLASQNRTQTLPEMLGENKASHSPELKVLTYWEEPTCWYKGARTGGKQRSRVLFDAERGDALWGPTSIGPWREGSGAEELRQGQGRQPPLFCDLLMAVLIIVIRVQTHAAVGKGLTSRALTEHPHLHANHGRTPLQHSRRLAFFPNRPLRFLLYFLQPQLSPALFNTRKS